MRVALVIDETDWHARALLAAFAACGVAVVPMRLADATFDTTHPHGLTLPGFGDDLPDAMLVRSFGGGGFEAVTRRLGLLHALRDLDMPVWNDARAIERCVDKSTTSFLLARAGIPTPATWTAEGIDAARAVVAREAAGGERLVCKPLFGAQGVGLRLIRTVDELPPPDEVGDVYYLQRYVPTGTDAFCDHRLFVVGGGVVAAMTRRSAHWVTNVRRGAQPEALPPDPVLCDLAVRATACVGAAYAGVDLLHDAAGKAMVLEVNSMPGWKGLQSVTSTDIAGCLARGLIEHARTRRGWIARAFRAACADELDAVKPGNVHVHAGGHGMTHDDFRRSAEAAAAPLCQTGAGLGARVLGAVQATRAAVGQNTNLGILLLCAPLAMAAEQPGSLQAALSRVLEAATLDDAEAVFRAIALAAPGGLGRVDRHDVRAAATVELGEAMGEAAARDRIARQYVTGFADVCGPLADAHAAALARHAHWPNGQSWAVTATYLQCLAAWSDSHIIRKHGPAAAVAVQEAARSWEARLRNAASDAGFLPDLLVWDRQLKRDGINPGTSADLTVATIFAYRLRNSLP